MSHTIAHRPHVHHIPLLPVLAVLAAVLIATAIIWAVAQPQTGTTTTTTGGEAIVAPVVHPAAVAPPESPVFRHALMRVGLAGGYERAFIVGRVHMVEGTTLDPVSTNPYGTAPYDEPNYPR
jgi:hypothetical protein